MNRMDASRFSLATMVAVGVATGLAQSETIRLESDALVIDVVTEDMSLREHFGPRFDETARVRSVRREGREYLHPYGLCDEFGILGLGVLGFDEAGVDGRFIKIGVGVLERSDPRRYAFNRDYPVVHSFPVTMRRTEDAVTVEQRADPVNGYAYRLTKTYRLAGSLLSIDYVLENTGSSAFSFDQYNHNWFQFDGRPIDRDTYVQTTFGLPDLPFTWLESAGDRWRFQSPILAEDNRYFSLFHVAPSEGVNVVIGDGRTGQRVEISSGFPVARFALFADASAVCPELFVQHRIAPGELARWTRTYRFEQHDPLLSPSGD